MKKHWYDIRETGCEAYPKYHLTHWAGSKKYTIMVLAWDTIQNKAKGRIRQAEFDTIRECRAYMASWTIPVSVGIAGLRMKRQMSSGTVNISA